MLAGINTHAGRLFETGSIVDDVTGAIELAIFCGIFIFSLVYYICLVRQRANDISGKNALPLTFLSFLIFGWLLGFIPGQKHANTYGAIPGRSISIR